MINEFKKYYENYIKVFDKDIKKYNKTIKDDNAIINDALNKFKDINYGGKYIRAFLIDLGYKVSGNNDNKSISLSIAYETFQTSILVHDDIIDKAVIRRGKDTIPYTYKKEFEKYNVLNDSTPNDLGICIGDYGLFLANKIIIDNYSKEKCFSKLFNYYNNIVINTIKGEILDVYLPFIAKNDNKYITKETDILKIYKLKTSWYTIVGPFILGLILGNAHEELIKDMEKCLEPLGIAFQIRDDILGIMSTDDVLGKSVYSDIEEFKQTILYSYINENKTEYLNELLKYYGKTNITREDALKVQSIIKESNALKYALDKEKELLDYSKESIKNINIDTKYKNILLGFIEYLETRKK